MRNYDTLQNQTNHLFCTRVVLQDCLFLSLVILLSLILYVQHLGFYSDDWDFLGMFIHSHDQSVFGLFRSAYAEPLVRMRPVQILYLSGLYWLFGTQPLGYHLVNAMVLIAMILLFYLILREMRQAHLLTLTLPLTYALLPHYSTDRFWILAFQSNLSMVLYFLSLYTVLRALQCRLSRLWSWKLVGILSLLCSILAYEVALPLFLLNLFLAWYRAQKLYDLALNKHAMRVRVLVSLGSNLVALVLVTGFKAMTTIRTSIPVDLVNQTISLTKRAIAVNYVEYGLGLPLVLWRILCHYPDGTIFALAGGLGVVIFGYLYHTIIRPEAELPSNVSWIKLILLGLVVFGLGYLILLTTSGSAFTKTGINNRMSIAAAVGVAMSLVGAFGLMSALLSSDMLRRKFFCLLLALLCMCGFLIINTIASFWITAYRQQEEVLADIRQHVPVIPTGSTLILDGVCPYVGPAVVFESNWDLAGALKVFYRDSTLRTDVVTPKLKIGKEGLSTTIYGEESHYPYNEKLLLYHFKQKTIYQLADVETTRRIFQTFNPNHQNDCPQGHEGRGVPVF